MKLSKRTKRRRKDRAAFFHKTMHRARERQYNEEMPVCLDPPRPAVIEALFRICHELRVRGIEFSRVLKVWLAVLERHHPGGEQTYLDLIQGIEPQHLGKMSEGFYLLLQHFTMEGSYYDLLGDVYQRMSVEWKGKAFGQYFTPWPVCLLIAQTTIDEAAIEKVKRGEIVTIHEPAVGSGALLLAAKGVIAQRAGRWRARFVKVSGQDLDPVCVDMAKIQVAMTDDRFMVNWGLLNVAELEAQQIAQAANQLDVKASKQVKASKTKKRPKATITSPHNVDGYAQWSTVRLLLEAKFDLDLRSRGPVCNVLGQCLLYVKKFEAGGVVPNVILVGDRKECFVLRTSSVRGFLDLPIDWTVAPSKGNPELTQALVEGVNVLPHVRSIDQNFDFNSILDEIEILAEGKEKTVRIDLTNIGQIFHYFENQVFKDPSLTAVEKVDIFLRALFHAEEVYPHPTKKGVLCVPDYPEGVAIDTDQYLSFFSHFEQGYRPSEIEAFYACKDRLVEDDARRRQGAFFTPDLWVAEAHKSLEKILGVDWKDECIVWDPAAGTANLTRNYTFADLIISTAEKPDIKVIKDQGYNPGASIFQYDFLNPESESPFFEDSDLNMIPRSVDRRLKAAAKAGKRLVFLMNPPYGTANNAGAKGTAKAGIAKTLVNEAMKLEGFGHCCRQLYAQFMYQCNVIAEQYGFKEHTVALFSMQKFMTSGSYRKFRHWWYERYSFQDAFLFQASHFADVSGRWGISFTIWSNPGKTPTKSKTPCMLKDPDNTFKVEDTGEKSIYNSDGREASKWVSKTTHTSDSNTPKFSSGLSVKDSSYKKGVSYMTVGVMVNVANNPMKSQAGVFFLSGLPTGKEQRHFCIKPHNYRRAIALYGARKLVKDHWTIHEDEYLVPNEKHPEYDQWVDDCHIYALLHSKNNCTSMRGVQYKGKDWDIHNHFFWLTRAEALEALDNRATPKLYRDCKNNPCGYLVEEEEENAIFAQEKKQWEIDGDPYFSHVLPSLNLSEEAQDVLDSLKALWTKSLSLRESYAAGKPELHLLSWDAGCYQLKHLWRDHFEEDYKALRAKFKKLEEKLKPGVYEFGFLLG